MIGGVCGGLAEFTGVESFLWRLGFIALMVFGGEGVIVRLVLWLVIPNSDRPPPQSSDTQRRRGEGRRLRSPATVIRLAVMGGATGLDRGFVQLTAPEPDAPARRNLTLAAAISRSSRPTPTLAVALPRAPGLRSDGLPALRRLARLPA